MTPTPRRARRALAAGIAAALLLVACGGDDTETATGDAPAETTTTATSETTAPSAADPTTTTTAPEGVVLEVTVAGGVVDGGGRTRVPLGETVTLLVTSDADDHVHLHGYDVFVDVAAGTTAELVFVADIPGVFEVELEDSRIPLWDLEIS